MTFFPWEFYNIISVMVYHLHQRKVQEDPLSSEEEALTERKLSDGT